MTSEQKLKLALHWQDRCWQPNIGSLVLLTGGSRSGKTLFLQRLAGLEPWPEGMQLSIQADIALLQDAAPPLFLGTTIADELSFSLHPKPNHETLLKQLAAWGLSGYGLDDSLSFAGRELALRLFLASATLAHRSLLLLDNPTASLDVPLRECLQQQLLADVQKHQRIGIIACSRWQDWLAYADVFTLDHDGFPQRMS